MLRNRAIFMLLLTTAAWGLSFPGGKASMLAMDAALPGRDSWFFSALSVGGRFGLAALLLLLAHPRALFQMTPLEWKQGIGLGLFGGFGMLVQADGLVHTAASTSAFLTQFVAVLVPLVVAFRDRRWPPLFTMICVVLVMIGVAILGRFDFGALRFGRGEVETLISTCFFTCLLLWIERPIFAPNHTGRTTLVMFAIIALVSSPVLFSHAHSFCDPAVIFASGPIFLLFLSLSLVCSLFAFLMMNHWQPHIDATTAGIVYCAEPLWGTAFALFMPVMLGTWLGVEYANESFTPHLLIGGTLITIANVLIALKPAEKP